MKMSKYIAEKKKLKALLKDEVWELLKHHKVFIAGGAITSLFTNREVNDIDVYFRDEESLFRALAAVWQEDSYFEIEIEPYALVFNGVSQRTFMLKDNEQEVQFMSFKYFPKVEDIFNTFDFTCCMGAYDCELEEFVFHPEFLQHNSQRYLKFNPGTAYPIMSLMRVDKYREKGYNISKAELLRVLSACIALKIESWKDVKEHCGGMYGYDMDEAFDEDKEFSLEEFSSQLSDIQERDVKLYTTCRVCPLTFSELAVQYFYKEEEKAVEKEEIVFDDEQYLYKSVDQDHKSPYAGSKAIHYKEGDIIEGKGDLYFHFSSNRRFDSRNILVECKVLSGEVVGEFYDNKKVLKGGSILVKRIFTIPSIFSDPRMEWIGKTYRLEA